MFFEGGGGGGGAFENPPVWIILQYGTERVRENYNTELIKIRNGDSMGKNLLGK